MLMVEMLDTVKPREFPDWSSQDLSLPLYLSEGALLLGVIEPVLSQTKEGYPLPKTSRERSGREELDLTKISVRKLLAQDH